MMWLQEVDHPMSLRYVLLVHLHVCNFFVSQWPSENFSLNHHGMKLVIIFGGLGGGRELKYIPSMK